MRTSFLLKLSWKQSWSLKLCTHNQTGKTKTGLITGFTHPYLTQDLPVRCFVLAQWEFKCRPIHKRHTGWILNWADGRISSAVPQPAWHFLSLLPSVSPSRFCAHGGQWLRCALLLLSGVCTALVVDQRVLEGSELNVCLNIYGYWKMSTKHSAVWCLKSNHILL